MCFCSVPEHVNPYGEAARTDMKAESGAKPIHADEELIKVLQGSKANSGTHHLDYLQMPASIDLCSAVTTSAFVKVRL